MTSSISSTIASILGTVSTVANAATKTVDNAADGLDMLSTYIRTAKEKQEARTAVDMSTFYDDLHKEAAFENAQKSEALERELQSNSNLKKHYEKEFANLEATIASVKTKYRTVTQ